MQDFRSDKKRIYTNAKAFYRNSVEEFTVLLTFERKLNISKTEKAHYMGIDVGIVREWRVPRSLHDKPPVDYITVYLFTIFIRSFWQQLFIYHFNVFHSCDSKMVGLSVNMLIDFDVSCKRTECDIPDFYLSQHLLRYLFRYLLKFPWCFFLCKQLLDFCD